MAAWVKGQSGNPAGRKRGEPTIAGELRAILKRRRDGSTNRRKVAERLVEIALTAESADAAIRATGPESSRRHDDEAAVRRNVLRSPCRHVAAIRGEPCITASAARPARLTSLSRGAAMTGN
jgi:hypothetical protein